MIKIVLLSILSIYLLTAMILIKYFEKNFMHLYLSIVITLLLEDEYNPVVEDIHDKDKYPKGLLTFVHRVSIVMAFNPIVRWKTVAELSRFKKLIKGNVYSSILEGHYAYLARTNPSKLETLEYFKNVHEQLSQ